MPAGSHGNARPAHPQQAPGWGRRCDSKRETLRRGAVAEEGGLGARSRSALPHFGRGKRLARRVAASGGENAGGGKRPRQLRMFDLNGDGKLCLSEMSRLLPVQENFLLKFQGMKLDSEEFNAIFAFYDKDGSGFIDENELDALLKDLYEKNKKALSIQQLTNYRKSIMNLSDGGKLYRKELEIVLCSEPPL